MTSSSWRFLGRLVLASLVGCGSPAGGELTDAADELVDAASDGARDSSDDVEPGTAGCGAMVTLGLQARMTTVSGANRRYLMFVPPAYDADTPTRLVFVFHGLGGSGGLIRSYLGFEAESGGQAIFVYPDGLPVQGTTGWSESDLAFFDTMLAEISSAFCVDPRRVFAAGHSYGAYMTNLVGCERGDVVTAIAPVSGGMTSAACDGPVAAWIAHGTNDTTVRLGEGAAARDRWRALAGCDATTQPVSPSPCVSYDGCAVGKPVTWCAFDGGHTPPAFARQAIWDFFAPLARP